MMVTFVLAAIAGWVIDDWCPTPPRPPIPWWLRKGLAVLGGILAVVAFREVLPTDTVDAVGIIVVGGFGGAFLASLVSMVMGDRMRTGMTDTR
jgi:hypothetical protein